jgi:hypothetical protein
VRSLQRWLAISCLVCAIWATYLSLRSVTLPEASLVDPSIIQTEPVQDLSNGRAFTMTIKGYTYTLTPKAMYDIAGLVVSQHRGDALFNLGHKEDPGNIKDVCVVWGEAVTNHLIPASSAIARRIQAIHVGDQIRMTGLLVDYTVTRDGQTIFTRRTSLTRSDTGNGACEILYVTDLAVVARGNHLEADAGSYAWYASLALLVALLTVGSSDRPSRSDRYGSAPADHAPDRDDEPILLACCVFQVRGPGQ